MRNVIVVIGSVTAKQYEPLRQKYLRKGEKVKIARMKLSILGIPRDEDLEIDTELFRLAGELRLEPQEVVEVVISEKEYSGSPTENPADAFMDEAAYFWPRLREISVVHHWGVEKIPAEQG